MPSQLTQPQFTLPPLGLYIHFPWCEKKCPYCDFNSHTSDDLPEAAYLEALITDLRGDLEHVQGRSIDSLFIGGGTPSLMSVAGLERLLTALAQELEQLAWPGPAGVAIRLFYQFFA